MSKKKPFRQKPQPQHPFEEYIVYRKRLREYSHLHDVMLHIATCSEIEPKSEEHMGTLRVFSVGFIGGFFDRYDDALKVFEISKQYLPDLETEITEAETKISPLLLKAKAIRDNVWAHANLSLEVQNAALASLPQQEAAALIYAFFDIAQKITEAEAKNADLSKQISLWGLPPGKEIPL